MIRTLEQINQEFIYESIAGALRTGSIHHSNGSIGQLIETELARLIGAGTERPLVSQNSADLAPSQHSTSPGASVRFIVPPQVSVHSKMKNMASNCASEDKPSTRKPIMAYSPAVGAGTDQMQQAQVQQQKTTTPRRIELPNAYTTPSESVTESKKLLKGKRIIKSILDTLFYAAIVFILVVTLVFSNQTNYVHKLLGYSCFVVLTGSMQREIPQGSLVVTKETNSNNIQIGDDITFIRSDKAIVTHRVVDIFENSEDSGGRGFQTQGVENKIPDADIVYEANIVGVVKLSVPELGYFLNYVANNTGQVFFLFGGIAILAVVISKFVSVAKKKA